MGQIKVLDCTFVGNGLHLSRYLAFSYSTKVLDYTFDASNKGAIQHHKSNNSSGRVGARRAGRVLLSEGHQVTEDQYALLEHAA